MTVSTAAKQPVMVSLPALLRQRWFLWPLALRVVVWLFLGHAYEMTVFQDASLQMVAGQGVYGRFGPWLAAAGDGYYAAPPPYAFMLWASGSLAAVLGGHWWLHQLLIKSWLLLADLMVMAYLLRRHPAAARGYWTLWFVPVVAIAQVQPDLWAGLGALAAFDLASRGRWTGAGAALGAAAAVKPVPLIILPFLAIFLVRTAASRSLVKVGLGVLGALVAGWLPYGLLFNDARGIADVLRFHAQRPIAGLTIPAGLLGLANAGLAAADVAGRPALLAAAAYEAVVRASTAYPTVTLGVFILLLARAATSRPWSLTQTFCVPLLGFLAANKVVHEHYILLVLPLLIATGAHLRGLTIAFSIYLLAAGSPLRYLPTQYGIPSSFDAWLPPLAGLVTSLGLAITTGGAAIAFGVLVLRFLAARLVSSATPGAYDQAWKLGAGVARAARRLGIPKVERLLEAVGTHLIPSLDHDVDTLQSDGIRLIVPGGLPSSRTYAQGIYEIPVTQLMRRLVTPGMAVVDVGAFCGYYSLLCSRLVGPSGMVYAFEPHPAMFGYLVRNSDRNRCRNILASNLAVAEASGYGELMRHRWPDHHWLSCTGTPGSAGRAEGATLRVGTITLDQFFRALGWPRVDLIKLDVEGAEHAVLRGMFRLVELNPHLRLIIEVDVRNLRRNRTSWPELSGTLRDLGFRFGYVIEQGLRPFVPSANPPARTICHVLLTRLEASGRLA